MHTLLEQYAARKAIVHVPEVNARYASLKVPVHVSNFHTPTRWPSLQLSVYIKSLVRLDLHLPYAVAGCDTLLNRRLELIAPRAAPAVTVTVVVTAEEVALCFRALLDCERDVDGFEQVFFERGVQGYDVVDIALDILGVQSPEKVAGAVSKLQIASCRGAAYRALSIGSAILYCETTEERALKVGLFGLSEL
jgi:hypothetical protein